MLSSLKPEVTAITSGDHCGLIIAGVKDAGRALVKVRTDYRPEIEQGNKKEQAAGRYVCDWLRATVFAEDPYTLAVAFAVLRHEFEFVRVKNNFRNEKLVAVQRTNMLANFRMQVPLLGVRHVFEVQFKLQDLFTITLAEHLFYNVIRAQDFEDLARKPLFHEDIPRVGFDDYQFEDGSGSSSSKCECIAQLAKKLLPSSRSASLSGEADVQRRSLHARAEADIKQTPFLPGIELQNGRASNLTLGGASDLEENPI